MQFTDTGNTNASRYVPSRMPNAEVAARFVDTAAMCAATTASAVMAPWPSVSLCCCPVSERTSHERSERALSIVSAVVNVLEMIITSVVSVVTSGGSGSARLDVFSRFASSDKA